MIKALIIDDEGDARFMLRHLIESQFANAIEIIGEADDVDTGIEAIKKWAPEIVFLDIKMPKGTGFDLLSALDTDPDFEVIFVTAYDNYAIKAFEFSAFGYLMKPLKENELYPIVDKLIEQKNRSQKRLNSEKRIKVLIESYGNDWNVQKLVISHMEGFEVVDIKDIIRLEGDGNYTKIVLSDQRLTSTKNLGEYENLLLEYGFFRIHQSMIVNLRHVVGFQKSKGGWVKMSDGEHCKLSRYRKNDFIKQFL